MSNPIAIQYVWNRKNVEKLFDSSYKYEFNHSAKRYIGWLFIALMQFGVVFALKKGAFELLLFSTIVLFYWYYGKKIIARRRAEKSFEKSTFRDKTIHMEVDENGFVIKSHEGRTQWSWDEVDEIVPLDDDIMIYKYPYFHYIPSNGFSSIEDKSNFKKMAKEHHKILGT
jgi:hypothetical protein